MAIAANKVHGVRGRVVHDVSSARLAREHNKANVICFGARLVGTVVATDSLEMFLRSEFGGADTSGESRRSPLSTSANHDARSLAMTSFEGASE